VKGISGLGNRTFSALTGILYAKLSGRTLVIDWSDGVYSDDGTNAFERFFVCPSARPLGELPETESITPSIWRGHLHDSVRIVQREYNSRLVPRARRRLAQVHLASQAGRRRRFQRHTSIHVSNLAYASEVAVLWNWASRVEQLRPYFREAFAELGQLSSPAILKRVLGEELALHPQIQARVSAFRAAHFSPPMVGVHLRMSDRRVRVAEILAQLDLLLAREPALTIFAATDNIEGKELLERRYPGVLMTDHWYGRAGASQHDNPESPDRLENGVEALVDLYLLAACDYLVGDTTSSFTRLAGLLRTGPEAQFVDVRPDLGRRALLERELWRRDAASSSVAAGSGHLASEGKYPIASLRARLGRRGLTGARRSSAP
jgi:hypothetical protein